MLIVMAVGIWAMHDAAAKWYAATYPVFVILFWRSLFGTLPVFALASRQGGIQKMPVRLHLLCMLRGTFGFCAFSSWGCFCTFSTSFFFRTLGLFNLKFYAFNFRQFINRVFFFVKFFFLN